jgi:hypothetical protein
MTSYELAYQMGTYRALAQMMRDAVRELENAQDEYDRKWAEGRLSRLAEQTTAMLIEYGEEKVDKAAA